MQSRHLVHITRAEWRWVLLVSIFLLLMAMLPFFILAQQNSPQADWRFMGALHGYQDAAASMSRMVQGANGDFLVHFLHTPVDHNAALVQPVYAVLGQLASFTAIPVIVMFHFGRLLASVLMYLAIYHLGASIWVKLRSRRIFFLLASVGSGLGWLLGLFMPDVIIADLTFPQAYPFYASLVNIHYPLAIASIAMLASVFIPVFRHGSNEMPSVANNGATVILVTVALTLISPDALIPISFAYIGSLLARWYTQGKLSQADWHWGLWVLVPALPVIAYDVIVLLNNPTIVQWLAQRGSGMPDLLSLVMSLGIPLIIAMPGLVRAVRRFEADGDRFMLLWFACMLLLSYAPLLLRHFFLMGLTLPLAYFATRSVEDFWFNRVKRRHRRYVYVLLIPLIAFSNILVLMLPIAAVTNGLDNDNGTLLEPGYLPAFQWLETRTNSRDVILAAPDASVWAPMWTGARVVYGHSTETFNAAGNLRAVLDWYAEEDPTSAVCTQLVDLFQVDYIIIGPRERDLGAAACVENYQAVVSVDDVRVYTTDE